MRWVRFCALAVTSLVAGCTTNRPLPDAAQAPSLIDYVQSMRRETSTLLDTVVAMTTTPTQDDPAYRAWGDHWCPRHVDVHSTEDMVRKIGDYCARIGGAYVEPYCTQTGATSRILFFAKFQRGVDLCQGVAATVSVQIVEPKPGMVQNPAYIDRLRGLGYRTDGDRAREAMAAVQAVEVENARLARELPRLRTRGTQVCEKQTGITYLGYVEDTSGPKIKVAIHEAYYNRVPSGNGLGTRVPTYQPETIWDLPEHWYICE